ncbi:hypothetical protein LEP1GSC191_0414 [Leptospira borgpetersenii serovar Mini str. 201000851]|uniref:Uncharacterized protein n=2 Tax=Leptospira borgpetersenii TaxID=174 RepID=M3FA11_LEPBO|nr:hypothetical protein [Leptospira borgpetersenii]EKP14064.1 hypothetical protein LEP1GSC128_0472 [Leptospira borgpetersenii str. 200801926]EMF98747.1 hypothetical protein LEP1GSC123_3176 [Leptospira borgpetersenii str. 200701203]ENO63740.1 hypothetical protein LEP1GSC191_0414 [Leptospira borgpetersenii serovar Mini str. 201000851]
MVSSFEKTFLFEYRDFGSVEFGKFLNFFCYFNYELPGFIFVFWVGTPALLRARLKTLGM